MIQRDLEWRLFLYPQETSVRSLIQRRHRPSCEWKFPSTSWSLAPSGACITSWNARAGRNITTYTHLCNNYYLSFIQKILNNFTLKVGLTNKPSSEIRFKHIGRPWMNVFVRVLQRKETLYRSIRSMSKMVCRCLNQTKLLNK